MIDLALYQREHLFLLIGTNPLPNYVAAKLLTKEGGQLYLVHSRDTAIVADRLWENLDWPRESVKLIQVSDTNAYDVYTRVKAKALGKSNLGLNYTGGTKIMAVHAHRAIREIAPSVVFSYLNTDLQLIIEQSQTQPKRILIGTAVDVSLETLMRMHGVTFDKDKVQLEPVQPKLCTALANLHTTKQGVKTWFNWRRKKSKKWTVFPEGESGLEEVEKALRKLVGGARLTQTTVAQSLGLEKESKLIDWFKGKWLEHYTLFHLKKVIAGRDDVNDYAMNLHCIGDNFNFEFDVAAMRGYQLFAISCTASDQKGRCKEHLLEAYIRAQQMGGNEARVALVCAYRDPPSLLAEIEEPWDAEGKLRVFGASHLLNLGDHLQEWFDSQP
jgi:hypothetical protein